MFTIRRKSVYSRICFVELNTPCLVCLLKRRGLRISAPHLMSTRRKLCVSMPTRQWHNQLNAIVQRLRNHVSGRLSLPCQSDGAVIRWLLSKPHYRPISHFSLNKYSWDQTSRYTAQLSQKNIEEIALILLNIMFHAPMRRFQLELIYYFAYFSPSSHLTSFL